MTDAAGRRSGVRSSDAVVAVVWFLVVDLVAAPPLTRWINGDPPQVRIDPDEIGIAALVPHRAIPVRVLDGTGSDHAILFIPVAVSIILITVGAVLVALFARTLADGDLASRRARRIGWWLSGLLCTTALGLPVVRGIAGDQVSEFGFVYEPDLRLLVAGLLVGACAVALRRADGPPPAPPVTPS